MAKYVAVRPIDFPLGSGVWAFQPGADVPEANVLAYGYDIPPDPYVQRVDPPVEPPGPASEAQAEDAKAAVTDG